MGILGFGRTVTSRRHQRLWKQTFRRAGLATLALALVSGVAFYSWKTDLPTRTANWISDRSVMLSSRAGFRVNEVLVTGRVYTPQEELLARLDVTRDDPIFSVALAEAQVKIAEIPWVKSVRVFRHLPNRLAVEIEERTPVALWQDRQKLYAVDADGVVLTGDHLERFRDLPLIVGSDAPRHAGALGVLLAAEPDVAKVFQSALRMGGRRWDLRLENGITVRLPEENTGLALGKLAAAIRHDRLLQRDIKVVDFRIADKMTVEVVRRDDNGQPHKNNI